MHQRDQQHTHVQRKATEQDDDIAPGRGSRSASLTGPGTLVSGLVQRKARDDNGVAPDASDAVAAASSSSGASLPEPIMRKFEASLGADLSSVRVHTGAESAAAASAVGARAYTMGQDIHFGAGQYEPSSAGGEHLLAHEVAHTVQQRGGTPTRQNKLEVSSPQDAAEQEADRAAGAMVSGTAFALSNAQASIARDADKKSEYPGSPPTPFDVELPPEALQRLDELTLESLKSVTLSSVQRSLTAYTEACNSTKKKLDDEKRKRAEARKEQIELALTVAGFMWGGAAASIGARLAGPQLTSVLTAEVAQKAPARLLTMGLNKEVAQKLTEPVMRGLANKRVQDLMGRLTPEKVQGAISSGAGKAAKVLLKVDPQGEVEDKAISFVDALLVNALDTDGPALLEQVGVCSDPSVLLQVYGQFAGLSVTTLRVDVETKARNFATQVASSIAPPGQSAKDQIVLVNAYGRERLASVHYSGESGVLGGGGGYTFRSWITPDMEPSVRELYKDRGFTRVEPSAFVDHLPDPIMEGAYYGKELVMRVNAWGRFRLVTVKAQRGQFGTDWGELSFIGWVPSKEETAAEVRGNMQIGGIAEIDPGKIHGLVAPTDPA